MNIRRIMLAASFVIGCHTAVAKDAACDSVMAYADEADTLWYAGLSERDRRHEHFFSRRWVQSTYVGLPLVLGGMMQIPHNKMFRNYRNNIAPKFHFRADDYVQYAPAAAMLGMKLAGVKGRSSWGKMLTADAFSTALMAAAVNGLKYTVRLRRPDGSTRNSFPSGHTATAFLTATMLHKEYGERYPWISISGYTVAAGIGGMRMLNNRHWMSDVLAGAGIGIMAGEFGYWLSDLVFPSSPRSYNRGTLHLPDDDASWYLSMGAGSYIPLQRSISPDDGHAWKVHSGGYVSFDAAWFWNVRLGVGGQVSQSNTLFNDLGEEGTTDASRSIAVLGGIYYNRPFFHRLSYFGRALVGGKSYYHTPGQLFDGSRAHGGATFLLGAGVRLRANKHFNYTLSCDYMVSQSPLKELRAVQSLRIGANFGYQF